MKKLLSLFLFTIGLAFAQPGIIKNPAGGTAVVGTTPSGSATSGNPVVVGGTDGTNTRTVLTSAAGRVDVNQQTAPAALVDANSNTAQSVIGDQGTPAVQDTYVFVFNGTTWDRVRTASLANMPTSQTLTSVNSVGAQITEKGARWSRTAQPSAGTQAVANIAAEANVRHVVDCVSFSAIATGATAASQLFINVRDGGSGAGTIIWAWAIGAAILAADGTFQGPHSICGLNLVGTTNTGMTAEFSGGLANLQEVVNISGFNVN